MDPARAGLRDARLFQELQQQRRIQMRNQILSQALYAYFEWVKTEELVRSYLEIANTASDRYEFVLDAYRGGDLSPIDTLEAYMQWKQRNLELTSAQNERLSAQAQIQNFLPDWNFQNWSPPKFDRISALWQERNDDYWVETLQQHPQILDLQINRERLIIERKLIREQFKPQLNIKYQLLNSIDQLSSGEISNTLSPNDYRWGLSFSYPIPLRKTRGQNQYNKIQQLENQFKIQQIQQQLLARMNAFLEIQDNFSEVIAEYELLIDDFRRLLEAERMMFELGESSLFMVNTRENRLLNAQITFINLQYSAFQNLLRLAQNSGDIEQHLSLNTN
jgi:outer membrane protein TolC